MTLQSRFMQVLEELKVSSYRAAKDLGTSQAVLSKIKHGQTPSAQLLVSIIEVYEVDALWLMTGAGNMETPKWLKHHRSFIKESQKNETTEPKMDIESELKDLKKDVLELKVEIKRLK